jgi:outer membrane protein assembly factor BamB
MTVPGVRSDLPCEWNDRLFVIITDAIRGTISLQAFNRTNGRLLWQSALHSAVKLEEHLKLDSPDVTPVTDGRRVFVAANIDGTLWTTAVDFNGRITWQRPAGPSRSNRNLLTSPVLSESLIIVEGEDRRASLGRSIRTGYLTALHRQTGEIIWRINRPAGELGGQPVRARVAGAEQLFLAGKSRISSYDPASGKLLWTCRWSSDRPLNVIAFDEEHIFASTQSPRNEFLAIRADGSGDVTETHVAWRANNSACGIASPVVYDGAVYSFSNEGMLSSLDASTGELLWAKSLGVRPTATPVVSGNLLYCATNGGKIAVMSLEDRGEIVAENSVMIRHSGSRSFGSPVIHGNRIYLRSADGLSCISSAATESVVEKTNEDRRRL